MSYYIFWRGKKVHAEQFNKFVLQIFNKFQFSLAVLLHKKHCEISK